MLGLQCGKTWAYAITGGIAFVVMSALPALAHSLLSNADKCLVATLLITDS